jgi:hypothetical protein
MWAEVDLPRPTRVLFNQTFAPGWRSSTGEIAEDQGQTAVDAPPGRYRLTVEYRPPELAVSVSITLVGMTLALLTVLLGRSRLGLRMMGALRGLRSAREPLR